MINRKMLEPEHFTVRTDGITKALFLKYAKETKAHFSEVIRDALEEYKETHGIKVKKGVNYKKILNENRLKKERRDKGKKVAKRSTKNVKRRTKKPTLNKRNKRARAA